MRVGSAESSSTCHSRTQIHPRKPSGEKERERTNERAMIHSISTHGEKPMLLGKRSIELPPCNFPPINVIYEKRFFLACKLIAAAGSIKRDIRLDEFNLESFVCSINELKRNRNSLRGKKHKRSSLAEGSDGCRIALSALLLLVRT